MTRTFNREPYSVSTNSKHYSQQSIFTQANFKGLCDDKNDATVDQNTFVDAKNVLVDDDGLLISRPPLKREVGKENIIDEWQFGDHNLLLQKLNGKYKLSCGNKSIEFDTANIKCFPIEDKIFIWTDKELKVFDTKTSDFEDDAKYLYIPTTKQVLNGIESDYESKNIITTAHKKRHIYNAISEIDSTNLRDKELDVYYNNEFLYHTTNYDTNIAYFPSLFVPDVKVIDNVNDIFLYRSTLYDKYYMSFGTNIKREIPQLNGIIYGPVLVEDGNSIMAFTKEGLYNCKIAGLDEWVKVDINYTFNLECVYAAHFITDTIFTFAYSIGPSSYFTFLYAKFVDYEHCGYTDNLREVYTMSASYISGEKQGLNVVLVGKSANEFGMCSYHIYTREPDSFNSNNTVVYRSDFRTLSEILNNKPVSSDAVSIKIINDISHVSNNIYNRYADIKIIWSSRHYEGESVTYSGYADIYKNNFTLAEGYVFNELAYLQERGVNAFSIIKGKHYEDKSLTDKYVLYNDTENIINLPYDINEDDFVDNEDRIQIVNEEYFIHKMTNNGEELSYGQIRYGDTVALSEYGKTKISFLCDIRYNENNEPILKMNRYVITSSNKENGELVKYGDEITLTPYDKDIVYSSGYVNDFYQNADTITISAGDKNNFCPSNAIVTKINTIIPITADAFQVGNRVYSTNLLRDTDQVFIDELVPGELISNIPTLCKSADEHYFCFEKDGKNLLEITRTQRNEDGFLLYLPEDNEQVFVDKITNLHPIAENIMGVFTNNEIFYVSSITNNDGNVYYKKAVKSKLPIGCRDGGDIITAYNGSALILATQRGITAMAPEQFVATSEPTLTYLSDTIQERYYHFYNDNVKHFFGDYSPEVKIATYRYWLLFYRFMDREVLAFDTRTNSWWSWTTPYPIKKIVVDDRLHFILQVDTNITTSRQGVKYLWCDREMSMFTDGKFPTLTAGVIGYNDYVYNNTISGDYKMVKENKYVPERRIKKYASSMIDWHITSQKLHFNAVYNYKAIKGISLCVKGTDTMTAKLSTKAIKDNFHPENDIVMEIKINDLRTLVKRLNLMHVTNFQYRLENDVEDDRQHQLKLNLLSVKYEVKEKIR